ncbi:hypothetical protein ABZP36_036013 [Zizania latifolia]
MASIPAVLRGLVDGGRHLRDASRNAARRLASWTRQGGAVRALVVVSVGSVALVTLTGLLIVVFVLVAAATSAAAVSVLVSLAALSAFLAAAYVAALLVVVFVVSATTAATVIAITIATGASLSHETFPATRLHAINTILLLVQFLVIIFWKCSYFLASRD